MKKLTTTIALLIATFVTYAGSDDAFVYPNPSQDQVYVQIPDNLTGITQLTVFDLSGREVYSTERNLDENDFRKTQIPVGELPNGNYIVRISSGTSVTNTMFTKQ